MKLLLIDSRIHNYQTFINSCKSDVDYVVFDYLTDTYASLLSKITAKGSSIGDIALVQHANMLNGFQMLANESICNSSEDAPFPSFNGLRTFLSNLKNQVSLEIFDLLACALYDAEKMPLVFQVLEQELAINLRASTNFTGNAPDGDWIMESDNVDIRDNYFTEAIHEWKGSLNAVAPDAPTSVSAQHGNSQVSVSFSAPYSDGGSTILYYTVSVSGADPAITVSGLTSPLIITGLTNGQEYTFKVTATNEVGESPAPASVQATPATIPDAPISISATPSNSQISVSFTAPVSNGGSAIIYYTVSVSGEALSVSGLTSPLTLTGLTNDQEYTFTVTATNAEGVSTTSEPVTATPAAIIPDAPTTVSATYTDSQVSVSFTAPASNGGSAILYYTVSISGSDPAITVSGETSPLTVAGLTNGQEYTFTVTATNAVGVSVESEPVSATPLTVPNAPTAVSATHADSEVTVSFTESASNGGSAILYYTVSVSGSDPAITVSGLTSPLTLTGLTNGVQYTLTVTATNAEGASIASEPVQATPATLPGVPISVVAQKGDGQAVVSFSAPTSDGGSAVLYYTVSVSGADPAITVSGEQSPITVTGLTNDVQYTLKVTATNAEGTSTESDAVQVTPATLPDGPTGVTAVKGNASAVVSFTAPVYDGGAVIAYYNVVSSPGSVTVSGLSSPITIEGLTNGQEYTFNVTAVNADAEESAAGVSTAVTPMTVPGVPTAVSAAHSSEQVAVSFAAPVSDGGSAVLYYTVSVSGSDPAITVSGEQSPIVVQGLTNGLLYTLIVTATNSEGVSAAEIVQATPATIPGAPTSVSAERGNTQVSVSFTAPASNGGSSILYYTVSVSGEAITVSGEQSPIVVQGLTNGQEYTLIVTATNAEGMSAESDAVQATPATVPDAPTGVSAEAGSSQASVSFTAPVSNGGDVILYYTVSVSGVTEAVSVSGEQSPILLTGLTPNREYVFTVTATNSVGTSSSSDATVAVIPYTVPSVPINVVASFGNQQISVTCDSSANSSSILYYTVTASGVSSVITVSGENQPIIVTGLTNGETYILKVTATNAAGESAASQETQPIVPATIPDAPAAATAQASPTTAVITITAPVSDGGSSVLYYTVTASGVMPAITVSGAGPQITISGLTNGQEYVFNVTATNIVGEGAITQTNTVTPLDNPSVPQNVLIEDAYNAVKVTFNAPASDGGRPVLYYVLTDVTDNVTVSGVSSQLYLKDLTADISHTFSLKVVTDFGESAAVTQTRYIKNTIVEWLQTYYGEDPVYGRDVKIDNSGNVYVIGYGKYVLTISGVSSYKYGDIAYITKHRPTGQIIWNRRYHSNYNYKNTRFNRLDIDASGNLYVCGYTEHNALYRLGENGNTVDISYARPSTVNDNFTESAGILMKMEPVSGNITWIQWVDGLGQDQVMNVKVDNLGDIIVGGTIGAGMQYALLTGTTYINTSVTLSGQVFNKPISVNGSSSETAGFIAKYSSNGLFKAFKWIDSNSTDIINDITVDSNNNIYAIGTVYGQQVNINDISYNKQNNNTFASTMIKYSTQLDVLNVLFIDGTNSDYGEKITVDSSNNIYLLGYSNSSTLTISGIGIPTYTITKPAGSSGNGAYAIKMNSSFTVEWVRWFEGSGDERVNGIDIDSNGFIYMIGNTTSTNMTISGVIYNRPMSSYYRTTTASSASYIVKMTSAGIVKNITWVDNVISIAGNSTFNNGREVIVDNNGYIHATGAASRPLFIDGLMYNPDTLSYTQSAYTIKYKQYEIDIPIAPQYVVPTISGTNVALKYVQLNAGSSPISYYTIYVLQANQVVRTIETTQTNVNISGLTTGLSYRFYVTATNSYGTSSKSITSQQIVPGVILPDLKETKRPPYIQPYWSSDLVFDNIAHDNEGYMYHISTIRSPSFNGLYETNFSAIYLVKYRKDLSIVWDKYIDNPDQDDYVYNIACDSSNNLHIIGTCVQSITLSGVTYNNDISNNNRQGILIKLLSDGTFERIKWFYNNNTSIYNTTLILDSEYIYVGGYLTNNTNSIYIGDISYSRTLVGSNPQYITKLDMNYNVIEHTWINGGGKIMSSAVDNDYLYLTGTTWQNLTISGVTYNPTSSIVSYAIYYLKMSKDLKYSNIKWIDGSNNDTVFSIKQNSLGNVYLVGSTSSEIINAFGTTYRTPIHRTTYGTGFVIRLDSSDNIVWLDFIDENYGNFVYDIAFDMSDNIYLSCRLGQANTYIDNMYRISIGEGAALIKYNSLNNYEWARSIGYSYLTNIYIDQSMNIFLVANNTDYPSFLKYNYYPARVTNIAVTSTETAATVTFNAPSNNGGYPILYYTATTVPDNISVSGLSTTLTISGLTTNQDYTINIKSTNQYGESDISSIIVRVGLPTAPQSVTASSIFRRTTVTFSAPTNNGGSSILYYNVTANPRGEPGTLTISGTSGSVVFTDQLLYDISYTFTVTAVNARGDGLPTITRPIIINNYGLSWATVNNRNNNSYLYRSVKLDSSGNIYIIGHTSNNTLTLSGYVTQTNGTRTISGVVFTRPITTNDYVVFAAKFDSNMLVQWLQWIGGSNRDLGYKIELDNNNNVYCTGNTYSSIINTGGIFTTLKGVNTHAMFLVKYNNDGIYQWSNFIDSSGNSSTSEYLNMPYSIVCDNSNNILMTCIFGNTSLDVEYYFNDISFVKPFGLLNQDYKMGILVKYDSSGNKLWHSIFDSSGGLDTQGDGFYGLTVDSNNNIFINAVAEYSWIGAGQYTMFNQLYTRPNRHESYTFISKLNPNGEPISIQTIFRRHYLTTMTVDSSDNILLGGYSGDSNNNNSYGITISGQTFYKSNQNSNYAGILIKLSNDLSPLFVKWIDGLYNEFINDITTDSYNNIYVGGYAESITVSISGPTTLPTSEITGPFNKINGYYSGFIAKYNIIGENQYVKWVNSLTHNSYVYGIDADPYGTIYAVGSLDGLNYTIDNIPFSKSAYGANGYITKIAELAPPRNVVVTPEFERIILTFDPAITTGIPLLTYRVQCLSGDTVVKTLETLSNNFTITGLANNVDYSFILVADYGIDIAPPIYTNRLSPTEYGTPLIIPNPPTNVVATPLNQSASVAFNYPEPAYDVAFYSVNVSPGNMTISGTVSPILVSGLTNGQEYTFSVFATNLAGTSSASIFSAPVTPNSAPAAPTNINVVGGDKQATLSWTPPAGTVSYYIIKASDYKTYTTTNTSLTISGLNNGNIYTFNVTAYNYIGEGIPSVESANAYIGVATNAPVIGTATISNKTATVTVTAPTYSETESFAATSYIAYAYPLGSNVATISGTSASTSISVANLVEGTNYTFKVRAINPVPATSAESDATNFVTATNGSGTVPVAPVITKVASDKEASFSWTTPPPVSTGVNTVSYIINFTISGGSDASTITNRFVTSTSITISGLTNGSFYNFNVRAVNMNGYGTIASSIVRPATIADAPTLSGGIIPTHRTLEFNFNAPAWNGGEDILYYVLTLPSASRTVSGLTSSFTISGLTNGTLYTGSLYAVNVMGNGTSLTISGIPNPTPSTVPLDAVAVSLSGGKARISFSAPVYNGGAPITSYQVLSSPGGVTASGSSPITISGLTDGTAYTFTVRALNSAGYSSYSEASNTVYPGTVPTAPVAPTVTITDNTATVAYTTTISAGTLPVDYYIATSTPENLTVSGTSSPLIIGDLMAGTSYTFSVRAVNNVGSSTSSSESNLVTATIGSGDVPAAPVITKTAGNTQATFSWTVPAAVSAGVNTLSYIINFGLSGGADIITNRFVTVSGITISGLTNGSFYNFSVRAVNINGYGLTATSPVRPATIADAPTISGSAIATHRTLQFNFNAPASNGGEDILYYVLSIPSISRTVSGISSPLTISGLTNGTLYSVMIYAVNAMGNGTPLLTTGTPNPTPATEPLNAYAVSQPNGTARIFFNPPTENGGAPVTSYEAISTPGSITASGVSFVVMTGLTNGTGYTFKARALNSAGYGPYSNVTNTIYPGTVPTAPAAPVATITNTTASVAYTATISAGTLPVEYYVATSVPHGISVSGTSSPISVPGLTAGTNYKFTVKAVSNVGESTESVESNLVTATEGAGLGPTNPIVTVVSVSGAVTITYVPVTSTPPVVSYTLFAPGIAEWIPRTNISGPFTVSGLTNGTSYSFTLKANNANRPSTGTSITAVPYTTPLSAPTITDISGKDGLVRVSFTGISSGAASTGGSDVTTYVATSTPGNIVGYSSTSPITISGLTDRTPYTFKVAAVNAAGTGIYSAASDTFTLQTTTPTTGESALFLSTRPDAPATTNYVQMYTEASTKTVQELYIELREAKKAYEATATEVQLNKLIKDIAVAIAIKAGSQTLDLSFSEIEDTFSLTISGLENKLVTTILPDFSSNAIPIMDLSSTVPTKYILLEVPTKALFQITDGNVTKTYMQDISGTTKYVTNTETGRKYYLGDSITVGTFSKRIVGFGSILLAETNVTVTLPITFTVSGVDVEIFGQLFTMVGTKINVANTLSATAFYDPCGQSWIQYMQDASENDFRATVKDISAAMAIKGAINSAVNIDASYNLAWKGYNNLDASAVFQNVESAWTKYHNLPDFVLSYFANTLLGHPGALAAISNDSSIRTNVSQGFSASLNEMQNMNEDKLKSIVQQMMNQDLARFNIDEKGVYNSLKFLPGDKVIMRMLLSNNTYSLKSPAGNPSSVVGGVTAPASQSASTTKVNIGTTDDYLLVFTLA